MKRILLSAALIATLASCKNEKATATPETATDSTTINAPEAAALSFDNKVYEKKSKLKTGNQATVVHLEITEAVGNGADSINNKIFRTVRDIVHFGEGKSKAKSYDALIDEFITDYETITKEDTFEDMPWEATVKASVAYKNDSIINIKLNYYTFTGGAHGYGADTSLLFNANTGTSIERDALFKDKKGFTALAEKKFRAKYKIPAGNINSTGYQFMEDKFVLPNNIFFTDKGLLLLYNHYEAAAYAEGQKYVLISYEEAKPFLK